VVSLFLKELAVRCQFFKRHIECQIKICSQIECQISKFLILTEYINRWKITNSFQFNLTGSHNANIQVLLHDEQTTQTYKQLALSCASCMHKSTTIVAERTEQTPNKQQTNPIEITCMSDVPLESDIIITYKKAHNTLAHSCCNQGMPKNSQNKTDKSVDQTTLHWVCMALMMKTHRR
jgi:hypothetical protein